jgi:LmbE family N-acetylglucosaminyl deacetylase
MFGVPRLLAFIPHPDDESYSFGGTLALAAQAGWECIVQCASSGEKGKRHDGGPTDKKSVGAAREAELWRSCEILGVQRPEFWRFPDGGLSAVSERRAPINQFLRHLDPDIVLTLGGDGAYGHPDHLALHQWVVGHWRAFRPDKVPLLFPVFPRGLFLPQYEKCIGMMGDPPNPPAEAIGRDSWDYAVPITRVREQKLAAIASHRSQLPGGDPEALFPTGIVASLLEVERFEDARGGAFDDVRELLASFEP